MRRDRAARRAAGPRAAVVAAASAADPAALVAWRGGLALGAGRTVRYVEGDAVAWEAELPGRVLALAGRDTLWVGTDAGLFAVAGPAALPVPLPGVASSVLAVEEGDGGRVWAATQRDGVWVREGGRWRQSTTASPVTGVADRGGVVWMGGQQGVSRLDDAGEARYTEEGTTDHGLLDNVVDRLVATADGAVWAVHPEGVSVFADGEPHGFRFVGRPGSRLLDVVALPAGGYVLATGGGVLWLPSLSERPEGFYEVYADSGASAVAVAGVTPAALGGAPAVRLALDGDAVWFASRAGLWSVPAAAFRSSVAAL